MGAGLVIMLYYGMVGYGLVYFSFDHHAAFSLIFVYFQVLPTFNSMMKMILDEQVQQDDQSAAKVYRITKILITKRTNKMFCHLTGP